MIQFKYFVGCRDPQFSVRWDSILIQSLPTVIYWRRSNRFWIWCGTDTTLIDKDMHLTISPSIPDSQLTWKTMKIQTYLPQWEKDSPVQLQFQDLLKQAGFPCLLKCVQVNSCRRIGCAMTPKRKNFKVRTMAGWSIARTTLNYL